MKSKFDGVNKDLKEYIETNIFPKYDKFYSHGMMHINNVINNMLMLAEYYNLNKNMAYTIASYHDLGLKVSRENHEYESGKILCNDDELKKYFTSKEINIMKEAIEDHRGSKKERLRNIYGECVSDSDRDFDVKLLAKRQIATSIKNLPKTNDFEEHFENCYQYIYKRINNTGKFNIWTNNPIIAKRRDEYQENYLDKEYTKSIYREEWNKISKDGTIEKIINYYEDY